MTPYPLRLPSEMNPRCVVIIKEREICKLQEEIDKLRKRFKLKPKYGRGPEKAE